MLFLSYWELNESMPAEQRMQITRKITSGGIMPKGVEILRWDITPDGWGITLLEAKSAADIDAAVAIWRMAGPGFFKSTRTAPAQPIQEAMSKYGDLLNSLASL